MKLAHKNHTITINYWHTLTTTLATQELVIKANVETMGVQHQDLEFSAARSQGSVVSCKWGPFREPWKKSLGIQRIELDTPKGLTLELGLDHQQKRTPQVITGGTDIRG